MNILNTCCLLILFSSVILFRCESSATKQISVLGEMKIPEDNPQTTEKIALGKKLFFDKRLSLDGKIACASCHQPQKAFTDGRTKSRGVFGREAFRNAPSILNAGYLPKLMFEGEISTLEMQALVPLRDLNEMGMDMKKLIERLKKIPEYRQAAKEIFKRDFDAWVLTRSLSAFERTLISGDSPFDRYYYRNEQKAIREDAKRGWKLFSEKLYCTNCHVLPFFTSFKTENNGYATLSATDFGRFRVTLDSGDIGKFKVPGLRNVALTAPYMHDGGLKNLTEVIAFYSKGGRRTKNQNQLVRAFSLSKIEKEDLIAFLSSLSDVSN